MPVAGTWINFEGRHPMTQRAGDAVCPRCNAYTAQRVAGRGKRECLVCKEVFRLADTERVQKGRVLKPGQPPRRVVTGEAARYYTFAPTEAKAREIADQINRSGETRGGHFVAGTFRVEMLRGTQPVVVGDLAREAK